MIKIIKYFLIFCCFNHLVKAGDKVGNGGGLSEQNIWHADSSLGASIDLCLASCSLSAKEKKILIEIKNSLQEEQHSSEHIIFKSEKKNPGFFLIDGQIKIAKTGSEVGGPIYINTDLLYEKKTDGIISSYTIAAAQALLIHEYGHHHQEFDHSFLDFLGTKVSAIFMQNSQHIKLLPFSNRLSTYIMNSGTRHFPQIYFYTKREVVSFSDDFKNQLVCPANGHKVWKSWKRGGVPVGAVLHNIYWKEVSFEKLEFELSGELIVLCEGLDTKDKTASYQKFYRAKIEFELLSESFHNKKLLNLKYRRGSFRVGLRNMSLWDRLDPDVINHR